MKKIILTAAIAAALSGCTEAVRRDQVPVRELRAGSTLISVFEDPVTKTTCFLAYAGLSCK